MIDRVTLAYLLILIGLALLAAEVFIPSGGILLVLAISALIIGVTVAFTKGPSYGLGSLIFVFIAVPIMTGIAFYFWPKTPMGKRFFLQAPPEDETLAQSPVNMELEQLRGRYGQTVSALRPSGITDFDGKRVDTISEGAMIGPGQWVQCIEVQAGKVVVRQVDAPPDLADMDHTDFT